jgi:molecular chaperone DnaK (HSP70)
LIGEFSIDDIPDDRAGVPKLEFKIDIDSYGIIKVCAVEQKSGKSGRAVIKKSVEAIYSDKKIERIIKEANARQKKKVMKL